MQMCYSALTVTLHCVCVDDLSSIQDGWRMSSEWVKWHGRQYHDVQDLTYMPISTFWGWRWCRTAMQTCYKYPYSALTLCGQPQFYPRWVREEFSVGKMVWMIVGTNTSKIPITCLIPLFWGWRWCLIAIQTCYSALQCP